MVTVQKQVFIVTITKKREIYIVGYRGRYIEEHSMAYNRFCYTDCARSFFIDSDVLYDKSVNAKFWFGCHF